MQSENATIQQPSQACLPPTYPTRPTTNSLWHKLLTRRPRLRPKSPSSSPRCSSSRCSTLLANCFFFIHLSWFVLSFSTEHDGNLLTLPNQSKIVFSLLFYQYFVVCSFVSHHSLLSLLVRLLRIVALSGHNQTIYLTLPLSLLHVVS